MTPTPSPVDTTEEEDPRVELIEDALAATGCDIYVGGLLGHNSGACWRIAQVAVKALKESENLTKQNGKK